VYVKAMLATRIQFSDGSPVIETLEEIKSQVARVLETFKPDFERRPTPAGGGTHNSPP
jgi:hypothetical protein